MRKKAQPRLSARSLQELTEWKDDTLIKHTTSADVSVANFLPVPVEDIIYDNGAERSRSFRIKGLQSRNGRLVELPVVKVDSADISNMNWVTAEWGFDAIIFPPTVTRKDTFRSVMFMIGQDSVKLYEKQSIRIQAGERKTATGFIFTQAVQSEMITQRSVLITDWSVTISQAKSKISSAYAMRLRI